MVGNIVLANDVRSVLPWPKNAVSTWFAMVMVKLVFGVGAFMAIWLFVVAVKQLDSTVVVKQLNSPVVVEHCSNEMSIVVVVSLAAVKQLVNVAVSLHQTRPGSVVSCVIITSLDVTRLNDFTAD